MSEVNKNISVNDVLLKLAKKPMKMDEFSSIERYFNALHDSFLIDFVNVGWYYDKNLYDFYFILAQFAILILHCCCFSIVS